ncbi:diiron oxygenase [Paraburkholderia sp. CNPSo 3281]|uniref:diiron oxygenase n=1 Tax=Paraburkholderia sp. CNPSo 3281 TaxID=2940933 RepID=UPI0020B6EC0E|nr:diiron oxygenase [Paraburkholderia sp. CNPSo 3281]MCP3717393.1 diiron oxygenase [Paraburkholderia sp. CNPSo 3281]
MNAVADVIEQTPIDPVTRWYAGATVRNAARIFVPKDIGRENTFPKSRQLLSTHPLVAALGQEAVSYVLAQSTYRYMYEIGLLETRFVIDCALKIINNEIGTGTSEEDKREAITIVIDEGYHAYVALDFIIQMRTNSGIEPLTVPQTNGNLDAVKRGYEMLPARLHGTFQLLATCLAEHTLTKDLLSIGKEKEATVTFTQVMTDHVSDEGRHANYFARLTREYWRGVTPADQQLIGRFLPGYLKDYLAVDWQRDFDRDVLAKLGLSAEQVETAIRDTDRDFREAATKYVDVTLVNLVKLLGRMGVIDHADTRAAFIDAGLLSA